MKYIYTKKVVLGTITTIAMFQSSGDSMILRRGWYFGETGHPDYSDMEAIKLEEFRNILRNKCCFEDLLPESST